MAANDEIVIRRMEVADLAAALALQAASYPASLVEDDDAFASRIRIVPSYCHVATRGSDLLGYLLAHGWGAGSPPFLGEVIDSPANNEVIYLHDLAVSASARGTGIGRRLLRQALALASGDGLTRAELIAVEGAADYWKNLHFAEGKTSAALATKVATYGPDARWMWRDI